MPSRFPAVLLLACTLFSVPVSHANAGDAKAKPLADKTVEQLAASARDAVVVITVTDRDGKQHGLGSGFVVAADGLIATNLHVIGEARPITVQLAGGKRYPVVSVHASDRALDLALVKIDAKDLSVLPLGDSDKLASGQAVVALGHPRGLKYSMVSGIVSGRPKIEDRSMIQLAMPIEQGNSGGPVLDLQGRVQGIVTLKSQVTANLGFAVPVNALRPLLKKPNPIAMERWITIGTLNPEEWTTVFEGNWRQRSGRVIADGVGSGFGGRSLCLAKQEPPAVPYEVSVQVKLDDEAGAAGLAFHSDGRDRHYGFYPSAGKLRLTRFEGPDVYSWKVLHNEASKHYRPGDWNTLKVRVEKDRLLCYVNDQLVLESTDAALTEGKVGLAKFRTTHAEFKNFQVGKQLRGGVPAAEVVARVTKAVTGLPLQGTLSGPLVEKLLPDAPDSLAVLRQRARELEKQAARLRELAVAVHHRSVLKELERVAAGKDEDIDLVHAALLIARLDDEELDVQAYRRQVERLAKEVRAKLPKGANDEKRLQALNKELFTERGFHGSRGEYYHRANSYLNRVLDDREGLPITLSLLYLELGRQLGLKLEGVGLPGHFVVRYVPAAGATWLIDVYEGGKTMSLKEAEALVERITGEALEERHLAAVGKRMLLVRVLGNLANLAQRDEDWAGFLRYHDAMLAIKADLLEERLARAGARYQLGDRAGALADVDWLLEHNPPGLDRAQAMKLRQFLIKGG
jgi:regulator of sirC expression with transglutaminase-like and TPR domain/S1-C subfamily serine protease